MQKSQIEIYHLNTHARTRVLTRTLTLTHTHYQPKKNKSHGFDCVLFVSFVTCNWALETPGNSTAAYYLWRITSNGCSHTK